MIFRDSSVNEEIVTLLIVFEFQIMETNKTRSNNEMKLVIFHFNLGWRKVCLLRVLAAQMHETLVSFE